jgi:hypothetical protein
MALSAKELINGMNALHDSNLGKKWEGGNK